MPGKQLVRGIVSRPLPQAKADNVAEGDDIRLGRYGDIFVIPRMRKQHAHADEGSYFVANNNNQTGIASPAIAAFAAVSPILTISNLDAVGGKRVYVDYLNLVTTAAGGWASAGVNTQFVVVLDNGDRYASAGTDLSNNIVCPNMDSGLRSIAKVRFGAIVAAAASGAARMPCALRILRPAVSATVADVVGETKQINFGGVESMLSGNIVVANANQIALPGPPLIIGPGQCALIYYLMNGTTPAAASFAPELAWWEA